MMDFSQYITRLQLYIKSLTLYDKLAWGAIILGILFILIGLLMS